MTNPLPLNRPGGVRDALLWDVAYALEQQHRGQFNEHGQLVCCNQAFPCPSAQLAARGLLTAQGYATSISRSRRRHPRLRVWYRFVSFLGEARGERK